MNKSRFTKLLSLMLALVMILGSLSISVSAAEDTESAQASVEATALTELLTAIKYAEYEAKYAAEAKATSTVTIDALKYDADNTNAAVKTETYDGTKGLYLPAEGKVSWKVNVPKSGKYMIEIVYYPVEGKATSIERSFFIDGKVPFYESRFLSFTKVWSDNLEEDGTFKKDINGNEIKPTKVQTPAWRTAEFKDSTGAHVYPFEYIVEAGEHTLTLEAQRESMAIAEIILKPADELLTYEEYLAEKKAAGATEVSLTEPLRYAAEKTQNTSDQTIYPINDRTSYITEPQDPAKVLLNSIGGTKWQTVGQWVSYEVEVPQAGLYRIVARFKQDTLDGMFTSRAVKINGEIPFDEAQYLQFNYGDTWQTAALGSGETEYLFYLEEGKNTIELEIVLGNMADIIRQVDESLKIITAAYTKILMITGASPDSYRDYGFYRIIPDEIDDLLEESERLYSLSAQFEEITGAKGSYVATLDKVALLLERMGSEEDEVAKNLTNLKSNIGTLGTWLLNAKNQPLELDYIQIDAADAKLPKANANFFQAAWYEISMFVASFVSDYNTLGAMTEVDVADTVEVWTATGRDQAQIIRTLINNNYTPNSGINVTLKLVAAGSLLPSVLAGVGPDVSLDEASGNVINWAIRSAVKEIQDFEGFEEVTTWFSDAAMVPLTLYGKTYGLPTTQDFSLMFYRADIFNQLGIEAPKTWDDFYAIIPVLQNNNMEVAFPNKLGGTNMFLYQLGGELYADDGMRINLDSNKALEAFSTLCSFFQQYKFPLTYDFANRFRTGEMPIGIASYNSYTQLSVYAPEIKGLWEFVALPGYLQEDGTINNVSTSGVASIIMMNGVSNPENSWNFMKWFVSADAQSEYANELTALLGTVSKHPTANVKALESLPWTTNELKALQSQFYNLAAIPEYPGGYIITCYVDFAFMDVYNNNADPVESMLDNITEINKEISRKRLEFGLEAYEISYSTNFTESIDDSESAE
ncbi:MAG: extracellular solute-binding protein [Clostridia bacterium]|nr:extracellular solute-binding protein [Clostridia bacterium]